MIGTEKERLEELDRRFPIWEKHTLWTRFEWAAKEFPDNDYIVFEDVTLTYSQTLRRINKTAKSLYALGVRKGTHVAVLMKNCPEYVYLTFALSKLGAVKIPININANREDLVHILNQSEAVLFLTQAVPDDQLLAECPRITQVISLEENKFYTADKLIYYSKFIALGDGVDEKVVEDISARVQDPNALSDILFTSGSTSLPKGAMLTSDKLLRSAYGTCRSRCYEIGRRMLVIVPLFHAFAYVEAMLALLYVGGTMVMSRQKYTPQNTLRILKNFKVNDLIFLGSMMAKLLKEGNPVPSEYPDLHAAFWGEASPDWLWDACRKAFDIDDITTGSGMTELSGAEFETNPDTPSEYLKKYHGRLKRAGCAGVSEYNGNYMEYKICNPESGEPVAPGEEGEIYYRGLTVFNGYYNNDEINAKAFTADGWFKSGDYWRAGEDGYMTYCGRKNDCFKVNGENVSPLQLDRIIGKCPLVATVETVGVLTEEQKEVGVAFIEPVHNTEENQKAIQQYCKENLAPFQVPKHFVFSSSSTWPRTGTGKLSKKELRKYAKVLLS